MRMTAAVLMIFAFSTVSMASESGYLQCASRIKRDGEKSFKAFRPFLVASGASAKAIEIPVFKDPNSLYDREEVSIESVNGILSASVAGNRAETNTGALSLRGSWYTLALNCRSADRGYYFINEYNQVSTAVEPVFPGEDAHALLISAEKTCVVGSLENALAELKTLPQFRSVQGLILRNGAISWSEAQTECDWDCDRCLDPRTVVRSYELPACK